MATAETRLPPLEDGELAEVISIKVLEKTTRPPAYYTEGTLLDDMRGAGKFIADDPELRKVLRDVSGLGTAATRDSIIEGLKHDRYLVKSGKHLKATDKGKAFIGWITGVMPELTDVAETARWEADLAVVAQKGGGADFENRVATLVKTLVARLKAAPPLGLASTTSTSYKESSRMSENSGERSNAPTPKMLEYASNIAKRIGAALPDDVSASFDACKQFIDDHKDAALRPTEKQLKFAGSIAERKGIAIPPEVEANGQLLSKWIDANK